MGPAHIPKGKGQKEKEGNPPPAFSRPRPVGWPEQRSALTKSILFWPAADDVKLTEVDVTGLAGEYSIVPGSDSSKVLLFFHGGGYCSGSTLSHRRLATDAVERRGYGHWPLPIDSLLSIG